MSFIWIGIALLTLVVAGLLGLRWSDSRTDESVWQDLAVQAGVSLVSYDPSMVDGLPEPAQRYFSYTIAPDSPLVPAVEIKMAGQIGLGSIDEPKYSAMKARQILAPPYGLVWRVNAGAISGSDGATGRTSWTRFWLFGVLPIVRVGGNPDHHRSAFGRVIAEGAFWTPANLLPGEGVRWEAIDDNSARAVVSFGDYVQAVDLTVADDGQPERVVIQRWSNENVDREFREQPFGGYLNDFRQFGGYTLPTSVEGGNHIGTDEYFPFFKAKITDIRLLGVAP